MDNNNKENVPVNNNDATPEPTSKSVPSDLPSLMKYVKQMESENSDLSAKLREALDKNGKLSQKTREGMQSALDTLMKKWMDAVETKDEKVKNDFKCGLEQLVKNSAEDNGVWQMMVSASALHERQTHNLDTLRAENLELRKKVDGMYAEPEARMDRKRAASEQLSRDDVEPSSRAGEDMWADFAASIGTQF